ncbi:MAG: 1-phosphofructokinase [Chloroflexota bacterium]|nr:MAG: 1-phosphofructokinase [Chloroflexota bacterium]
MLLTITPNPTIDRMLHVPKLTAGLVHRATSVQLGAGGKGLNTARAARTLGGEVVVTAPLAGHSGRLLADLLAEEGLPADWYWLESGETRAAELLTHDSGDATVINEPGESMSPQAWEDFAGHVERLASRARAVAFCGSLLPGVEPEVLGVLARALVSPRRAVYLDTSVAALAAALTQPSGLCLKVNRAELAVGLGRSADSFSISQVIEAGQALLAQGAALVVVTLGAEGALGIAPEGCWQASSPWVKVVSTVGSGDSFLAGLAIARMEGGSLASALALGVACGAANATTHLPGRFEHSLVETLLSQVNVKRQV